MEILPADDQTSDSIAEAANATELDSSPEVHGPLGVELLEDKILFAAQMPSILASSWI